MVLFLWIILGAAIVIGVAYVVYLITINQLIDYLNRVIMPEVHRQLWHDFVRGNTTTTINPQNLKEKGRRGYCHGKQ